MKSLKPFIKWVGGKSKLLKTLKEYIPNEFDTYIEPFLGGGAMVFYLQPKKAIISDINAKLINTYIQVRDNLEQVIIALQSKSVDKETYLKIRSEFNQKEVALNVELAAKFIYLNKASFGGVYRENSKGEYNVPFANGRVKIAVDYENLKNISCYLNDNDVKILHQSFEKTLEMVGQNDFIYLDPPYIKEKSNSFTKYNKDDFGVEDCKKIFSLVTGKWLMSNSVSILDSDVVKNEYKIIDSVQSIGKHKKKEVIIFNLKD